MSHIQPVSLISSATIAAYRMVKISAANTVVLAAAASDVCIGVTQDSADAGQAVPVAFAGKVKLEFNDTLAAGALVASNNLGQGVPHVNVTAGSYIIGYALQAVATTGTVAEVMCLPQFKSIP